MKTVQSGKKTKNNIDSGWLLQPFGGRGTLLPDWFFYPLIFITLAVPNLIYSGLDWYDTLHIMKWAWAMLPVAFLSLAAGIVLLIYGPERTGFKFDPFAALWLIFIIFISMQPLFCDIFAVSTYLKEWLFFGTLFGSYILCYNLFKSEKAHRTLLWCANFNAAVNIVFAELVYRQLNGEAWGVMNVPGNYIGNTGQLEMFGLWMSMAVMNCIFLHMSYTSLCEKEPRKYKNIRIANLAMLIFVSWGLWSSTTRGAILGLITGLIVLSFVIWNLRPHKRFNDMGVAVLLVILVLMVNIITGYFGWSRSANFMNKTTEMIVNARDLGGRREIWISSANVAKQHPLVGVGLGHFKWHYLEGQRVSMKSHPELHWQFTYWAHSEYLQWFAEFGIIGTAILLFAAVWWIWSFLRAVIQKKELPESALWAVTLIFLMGFDAIFSRPFHRIENVIWITLAFAITNRVFLPKPERIPLLRNGILCRALGLFMAGAAVFGMLFFYSGCVSDKHMRAATLTTDAQTQRGHIDEALKSVMGRDEANEQLAYHKLAVARVTGRVEDLNAGIDQLYQTFKTRPTSKILVELINLAYRVGNQELLDELMTFVPKGIRPPIQAVDDTPRMK